MHLSGKHRVAYINPKTFLFNKFLLQETDKCGMPVYKFGPIQDFSMGKLLERHIKMVKNSRRITLPTMPSLNIFSLPLSRFVRQTL